MTYKQRRTRGLSIIELLIATALAAVLLTSVASALNTVCNGTRVNEATMRARQAGTNALNMMLTKIRRSKELDLLNPTAVANEFRTMGTTDEATYVNGVIDPTTATHTFFIFGADPVTKKPTLFVNPLNDSLDANARPLLRNVRNVIFRSLPAHREVAVEITIEVPDAMGGEGAVFTIAGSGALRVP